MTLTELRNDLGFFYIQRIRGFNPPMAPYFDSEESTNWFTVKLQDSKCYLEWGSGGSTYLAGKLKIPFTSIDSDDYFLRAVKQKLSDDGLLSESTQRFIYRNIGLTKSWGRPVIFGKPSNQRMENFRRYSDVEFGNTYPDLILVDARFRVACALKCFRELKNVQQGWTLVVDDYKDRPQYRDIEKFGVLQKYVGRMAVFNSVNLGNFPELDTAIKHYEIDSR